MEQEADNGPSNPETQPSALPPLVPSSPSSSHQKLEEEGAAPDLPPAEGQKATLELLSAPVADPGKETRITEEKLRNAYLNPALIDPEPLLPPLQAPDLSKVSVAMMDGLVIEIFSRFTKW